MKMYRAALLAGTCCISFVAKAQTTNDTEAPLQDAQTVPAKAQADVSADSGDQIQDIVVTAQKRSESINRVALAITAIDGGQLERLNITKTEDLPKLIPALTVAKSQNNTPIYTLRGVGFQTLNMTASSPVGIYVDEISYTYPYLASNISFDLARVEVLKGPQGTLYGRSTTGGLVNYITAKPKNVQSGSMSFEAGNYGSYAVESYFTGPITNTLSFRLAGRIEISDRGWQRSVTRPYDRLGEKNRKAARGQLLWEPNGGFDALLTVSYWKDNSDTQAPQAILYHPLNPQFGQDAQAVPSVISNRNDARLADWTPASNQPAAGQRRPPYRANGEFYSGTLHLNYRPSDTLTLTSITAYSDAKRNDTTNVDGLAIEAISNQNIGHIKSFSEEFRVAGRGDRFNWLMGGYYSNDDLSEQQITYASQFSVAHQLNALALGLKADPAAVAASFGVPPEQVPNFVALANYNTSPYSLSQIASSGFITQYPLNGRSRSYAAFANADYKILDQLKLTVGGRFTRDELTNSSCAQNYDDHGIIVAIFISTLAVRQPRLFGPNECMTALPSYTGFSGLVNAKLNKNNFSYRATLDWTPSSNILIYASVARGYKSGSYPALPANVSSQLDPATQEKLQAYEGGVKAGMFDRHVQMSLSGYYYDYKDKQFYGRVLDPIFVSLASLSNIPKSQAYGGEAELVWRVTRRLDLRVSGAYLHTKVEEYSGFDDAGVLRNYAGARFPYSPAWSGSAAIGYSQPLSNDLALDATVSANYQSKASSRFAGAAAETAEQRQSDSVYHLKAYAVVDATIGIGNSHWRASIWSRNLFNKYYWISVDSATDTVFRYVGMPRTFGGRLTFNF